MMSNNKWARFRGTPQKVSALVTGGAQAPGDQVVVYALPEEPFTGRLIKTAWSLRLHVNIRNDNA